MKIAIFHELQELSGARKMVDEYGKILNKNHTVDLYYVDDTEDKKIDNFFTNVNFFKFKDKKWMGRNWKLKLHRDTIELLSLYFLHKRIASIINKGEYDFAFIHPSKLTQAPFILRFLKVKSVYYSPETLRFAYDDNFSLAKELSIPRKTYEIMTRSLRKRIDKKNISRADVVLVNSRFTQNNIKKAYNIKSIVCYPGVDEDKYVPKSLKKTNDLFFLGEKTKVEGYNILIKALNMYEKIPDIKYVQREKKPVNENDLIDIYCGSRIALALSRNEPFGLATIEAMSCGVPVIALNEGGFIETVINSQTGYLVKNEKEIKEKIDLLLRDEVLRNELGKSARTHVLDQFTWKKSVERFLEIVEKNI